MLLDSDGNVVATAVTNEDGYYLFDNLAYGTYTILINTMTLPAEKQGNPAYDPDGGNDNLSVISIDATNPHDRDQDFAYFTMAPKPTPVATIAVVAQFASIDFNKTVSAPVITLVGSRMIEYTLTYTNSGNAPAQNVSIVETVPTHTTFDQANSDAGWNCPNASGAGVVCTFEVGTIAPNTTGSVTFVAVVNPFVDDTVMQIVNNANVVADLGAGLGVSGAAAASQTVQIQRPTSLELSAQPQFDHFIRLPFVVQ